MPAPGSAAAADNGVGGGCARSYHGDGGTAHGTAARYRPAPYSDSGDGDDKRLAVWGPHGWGSAPLPYSCSMLKSESAVAESIAEGFSHLACPSTKP